MLNKIIIILWVCLICFSVSHAQHLEGIVYESTGKNDKIPLTGVNVFWPGTFRGTVTDENGEFYIHAEQPGDTMLIVSYIGYTNDSLTLDTNNHYYEIVLNEIQILEEVVVSENQRSSFVSEIQPLHVQSLTGHELKKAACCNLSESFETNASVDVSYSDAVTGAKRIELLCLHGKYTQMMTENIPNLRGLSSTYGLGYIPGSWMESIQISKGTSSVVNGYESITGQINTEFKKPDNSEKFFLNGYINHIGKYEGNVFGSVKINDKWSTAIFGHAENFDNKIDRNGDSFLDQPLVRQFNVFNRWKYMNDKHTAQLGINILNEERTGGQLEFDKAENPVNQPYYGINIKTNRYEVWGKTGYVFENLNNTSIGFVNSFTYYDQASLFGLTRYSGKEKTYYANLIFQSVLGSEKHKYSTGLSYIYDDYRESLSDSIFSRIENVPGAFFQYTYSNEKNLTILAGIRADFHNNFGAFYTPRVHLKYNLDEHTIFRASGGKGYRTANIISENSFLLASSRKLKILEDPDQEKAWNYGVNLTRNFDIAERELSLNIEFYRTEFQNQVIIDRDSSPFEVNVYNLKGKSYSNSFQVEVAYELIKNLDLAAAFRINDVKMTINDKLEREPLVNKYKGLLNLSYLTYLERWQFDFTTQLNGNSRLPKTSDLPEEYRKPMESPEYVIINSQITRYFRNWDIYLGVENLTDFRQTDPIIAPDDPYGPYFDSSVVWGPLMGRKFYLGIRYQFN
ncbi:MAG: TonB-dependent receptor [Bacteroidales bacterium]|nr:TonB-dependent receptor [Bacteroidales bacterium]